MPELQNASTPTKKQKTVWFLALLLVVLLWGLSPINANFLLSNYFAAPFYSTAVGIIAFISLLIINSKKLKLLNKDYFKLAIPTGIVLGLAELVQKIGLPFTTPARYAFLEQLSVVVVPVLMFIFTKKKPTVFKIVGAVLCLAGSFILSGVDFSSGKISFGIGEILCALAGVMFGVNIAMTGAFAKKLDSALYVMVQMGVYIFVGIGYALISSLPVFGGSFAESFYFKLTPLSVSLLIGATLLCSTLCWILRTNCMKYIDPTIVAIVTPCSAVVTGISSVLLGSDKFTSTLLIGGLVAIFAVIISGLEMEDVKKILGAFSKKKNLNKNAEEAKTEE